jgi:multicomponent Na+:H+ antiporter subunit C
VEGLLAILVGVLFGCGVYALTARHLLRVVLGLVLLSNGANLLLLTAGRIAARRPPLVPDGATAPAGPIANPVPQALILTAIVIGFGLLAFALLLTLRVRRTLGTEAVDGLAAGGDA